MTREFKYPPRVIVSILGTINAGVLIDYLLQAYANSADFIKPEYLAVSAFVIFFGFFSAVYMLFALSMIIFGPSKDVHLEFNDEVEMAK